MEEELGHSLRVPPLWKREEFPSDRAPHFNRRGRSFWICNVASALQFLGEKSIDHMDVKPENLLFRPNFSLALTDFGCTRTACLVTTQHEAGTHCYGSEEVFPKANNFHSADIYSLGICLYERVLGKSQ